MKSATIVPGVSRAVIRPVEPGNLAECESCEEPLKFTAKIERRNRRQVICNIYVDGKWDRVEHFHPSCYKEAGEPYGKARPYKEPHLE